MVTSRATILKNSKHRLITGFTLIELAVVLLLLAMVVSVVTIRVQSMLQRSTLADILRQARYVDTLCRTYAHEHDQPVVMVIDLDGGTLRRLIRDGQEAGEDWALPNSWRITRVLTPQHDRKAGEVPVGFCRQGVSPTYAVRFSRSTEDAYGNWVIFAGLTGVAMETDNDDYASNILRTEASGLDAR